MEENNNSKSPEIPGKNPSKQGRNRCDDRHKVYGGLKCKSENPKICDEVGSGRRM